MFGPDPTPAERAAYWLISDLGVVNRRLDHLVADDLRAVLTELCPRVIRGASRAGAQPPVLSTPVRLSTTARPKAPPMTANSVASQPASAVRRPSATDGS